MVINFTSVRSNENLDYLVGKEKKKFENLKTFATSFLTKRTIYNLSI